MNDFFINHWVEIILAILSGIGGLVILSVKIGEYKKMINTMYPKVEEMWTEIKIIRKWIDDKIYKMSSPLKLTELGEKLVKESGFLEIFESRKDDLIKELEKSHRIETQYDAQEVAREFMHNLSLKVIKDFNPIKTYAYRTGQDYSQILRAGSILLRDYYLSQHPEIKE